MQQIWKPGERVKRSGVYINSETYQVITLHRGQQFPTKASGVFTWVEKHIERERRKP